MSRRITVKPYQRIFRRPLCTARGEWAMREGFLVRLEKDGQVGYSEVAPLPDFGSETVAEAGAFLEQLMQAPELEVPRELPCCAFALSAALLPPPALRDYAVSALLPSGEAALELAREKVEAGYGNLKWKIGVGALAEELAIGRDLLESLPAGVRVRFDANASLTGAELERWLEVLASYAERVDYIEQPLACGEEAAMAKYMQAFGVAIALDESLNGTGEVRWLKPGVWAGPLVIKAPLMGDVADLITRLEPLVEQVVLSSVFETGIGLENILRVADALPGIKRAIGCDTVAAFNDNLNHLHPTSVICAEARSDYRAEQIWNLI